MRTPASVIKARLRGSSYRKLGAELGVSAGHLCHVVNGTKEAGDDLLRALGMQRVTRITYREARTA
jgi:hypothetical protein